MAFGSVQVLRKTTAPSAIDTKLLDHLPVGVMLCDPRSFVISYVNAKSLELLQSIAHALPVKPEEVVGAPISIFHDGPDPKKSLLANSPKLPHKAVVALRGEVLEFHIDAVRDPQGRPRYAQLTWNVKTKGAATDAHTQRLLQMVDEMPINVMTCTLGDFRIDYANKASLATLRRIERYLPIKIDQLVGSSIDIFHKQPTHVRAILADPKKLPHSARFRIGPETMDLRASAIMNADGSYAGPMITWSLVTETVAIANGVTEVVDAMKRTSETAEASSQRLLSLTERSEQMASAVSTAAVEMSASFDELSNQIRRASNMSRETSDKAGATDKLVRSLDESVEHISTVTTLIEKIASQTNLLALNATIEAARVGELGKGFAVVAQEVKALALQTAKATQDIRLQVGAVQEASGAAADAVSEITGNIGQLSEVFVALSAGMDEQSATSREVSESITGVSQASAQIRDAAGGVSSVAGEVSGFAERLGGEVAGLLNRR
ncbi:methyl-accepting chemotaxis protein [Aquabacter sp. CN5-332]|uniref:methyl-accepting chemotaxis protein n=1 Tax=Aquabacter sp. CN5-332 TaxID=3156608 RepID=UPI0032B58784